MTHSARAICLADALDTGANLLTPVRLLMALGVLLGHSFVVFQGRAGGPEPLILFNITLSYAAVNGFFILSGLLITRSFDRRPEVLRFVVARALRLFPALIVLTLGAVLVFGPAFTLLSPLDYLTDPQTWRYVCDVLTFGNTAGGPAFIFPNNPYPGEFSASLWTLRYEVFAYGGSILIGMIGLARSRGQVLALFVLSVLAFMVVRTIPDLLPKPFMDLTRLSAAYLLGATLYAWRHHIRISAKLALGMAALALIFGPTASYEIMLNFALAGGILLVGFGLPSTLAPLARIPDLSYGIYIWQWPIMQSLYHLGYAQNPYVMMAMALPLSALIAAISWYGIEKPALTYKTPLAAWLKASFKARKTA